MVEKKNPKVVIFNGFEPDPSNKWFVTIQYNKNLYTAIIIIKVVPHIFKKVSFLLWCQTISFNQLKIDSLTCEIILKSTVNWMIREKNHLYKLRFFCSFDLIIDFQIKLLQFSFFLQKRKENGTEIIWIFNGFEPDLSVNNVLWLK